MVLVWKDSRLAHSLLEHPECLAALTTRRSSNVPAGMTAHRARRGAAPILMVLCVASLGCFSDPINRAPVVTSINSESNPVMPGKDATFTATASDPDSDSFTLSWAQKNGQCTALSDPPTPTESGERFPVKVENTTGPFCVWAFATDRYGAVGVLNRFVEPGNFPPVAMIALLTPAAATLYPLYTPFELSNTSTDPEMDPFTSEWSLDRPAGSTAQLIANGCTKAAAGNDVHCFTADVSGQYTVALKATTPNAPPSRATMVLNVNKDTLPCIDMPDPKIDGTAPLDPTQAQSFTVGRVIDDGDPFPSPSPTTGMAHFNWYFTLKGDILLKDDVLVAVEHDYPTLPIPPDQYHEGDVAKIRVQVYDRNRQTVDDVLKACGEAADQCAGDPTRPTCYQRVTWTVNWL